MALRLKSVTKNNSGEYWKIVNVNMNPVNRSSKIKMALYENRISMTTGGEPLDFRQYIWEDIENPFTFDTITKNGEDLIDLAYNKIKKLPEWEGAEDIYESENIAK